MVTLEAAKVLVLAHITKCTADNSKIENKNIDSPGFVFGGTVFDVKSQVILAEIVRFKWRLVVLVVNRKNAPWLLERNLVDWILVLNTLF